MNELNKGDFMNFKGGFKPNRTINLPIQLYELINEYVDEKQKKIKGYSLNVFLFEASLDKLKREKREIA